MARELKVYSFIGSRGRIVREWLGEEFRGHDQSHEVIAAHSAAEAVRIIAQSERYRGIKRPNQLHNFGETWNDSDTQTAMAEPLTLLWAPLSEAGLGDFFRRIDLTPSGQAEPRLNPLYIEDPEERAAAMSAKRRADSEAYRAREAEKIAQERRDRMEAARNAR
jgi:hypothetical protein